MRQLATGLVGHHQEDHLILAVSEAATNAAIHGVPPVGVRIWLGADRVVVHVRDEGDGPTNPLTGLLPSGGGGSGRGMWIARQVRIGVGLIVADRGFTVPPRAARVAMAMAMA